MSRYTPPRSFGADPVDIGEVRYGPDAFANHPPRRTYWPDAAPSWGGPFAGDDNTHTYTATFDTDGYVNDTAAGIMRQVWEATEDAIADRVIEALHPWLIKAGWTPPPANPYKEEA